MKCELSHPRRLKNHTPYTTAKSTTVTLCPLTNSKLCCPKHFNSKNTVLALHCQSYNRKSTESLTWLGKFDLLLLSQLWFWPSSLYWFRINFCNNRSFRHCVESSEERSALLVTWSENAKDNMQYTICKVSINYCNNRSFIHCVESSEERSALLVTWSENAKDNMQYTIHKVSTCICSIQDNVSQTKTHAHWLEG
jgi:hypothetical protein